MDSQEDENRISGREGESHSQDSKKLTKKKSSKRSEVLPYELRSNRTMESISASAPANDVEEGSEGNMEPEIPSLLRVSPRISSAAADERSRGYGTDVTYPVASTSKEREDNLTEWRYDVALHDSTQNPPSIPRMKSAVVERGMEIPRSRRAAERDLSSERNPEVQAVSEGYRREIERLTQEIQENRELLQFRTTPKGLSIVKPQASLVTSAVGDDPGYNRGRRGSSGGPPEADGRRPRPNSPESFGNGSASHARPGGVQSDGRARTDSTRTFGEGKNSTLTRDRHVFNRMHNDQPPSCSPADRFAS